MSPASRERVCVRPRGPQGGSQSGFQGGFSLIMVIFFIVVLAGLAAFAVQVATSQSQGASLELLEARAQAAADAGIEYAANRALDGTATCANATLNLNAPGLAGYSVSVQCSSTSGHMVSSVNTTDYVLTATTTYGVYGQPGYVRRTETRTVTDAPP